MKKVKNVNESLALGLQGMARFMAPIVLMLGEKGLKIKGMTVDLFGYITFTVEPAKAESILSRPIP